VFRAGVKRGPSHLQRIVRYADDFIVGFQRIGSRGHE